jgi:cyclic pyranopterin phosphate synthase
MENNIDYLRFSLTDRCNLNCRYCTPLKKARFLSREEVLSYEEITKVVALFVKLGVRKLRLTGGEPLIKKNIVELVAMLKQIKGLSEIAMTTNGVYLKNVAGQLKKAGLDRVNISIDTLKREKFKAITGYDYFNAVWQGINESVRVGLSPVKLNVILMKGVNEEEILDFARLTIKHHLFVRFIELFPVNKRSLTLSNTSIRTDTVKEKITSCFGRFENFYEVKGNGPAKYYKLKDSKGAIGFISSLSENFCDECNRLRIDCAGRICPCLFSGPTHDIKHLLRSNEDDGGLFKYIKEIFKIKSKYKKDIELKHQLEMSSIGG